jgi:hypothetical protein
MIKFENPDNLRYYYIDVDSTNTITVIRGGQRVRVVTHIKLDSIDDVQRKVQTMCKRRLQHGYIKIA